jgi:hypothetical protein
VCAVELNPNNLHQTGKYKAKAKPLQSAHHLVTADWGQDKRIGPRKEVMNLQIVWVATEHTQAHDKTLKHGGLTRRPCVYETV